MSNRSILQSYEHKFNVRFYIPQWSDSPFQERLMRFGREYRKAMCESPYDSTTHALVANSFVDDLVTHVEYASRLEISESDMAAYMSGLANKYRFHR